MNIQQMVDSINRRIDDVIELNDAVDWINEAQSVLGIAVGARFPTLPVSGSATPVFDDKYHHLLVLYASARYKEQDSSLSEANNFMSQFEDQKREFVENYEIPPHLRDDRLSQQFTAEAGTMTFKITKNGYYPTSGNLQVYVNDGLVDKYNYFINDDKSFTLSIALNDGDKVTAVWEEHNAMNEPPYPWWSW